MAAHLFSQVPKAEIPRSWFNRDHTVKTTLSAGKLVPFFWDDVLPGDSFNVKTHMFCRMATLISPIMDDLWIDTHYFFVPYRLVWDNFQKFMGERKNPDDSIDYVVPSCFSSGSLPSQECEAESVADYLGLPLGDIYGRGANKLQPSALVFRAYSLIWNEWFRDENLQDSMPIATGDVGVFGVTYDSLPNGFKQYFIAGSCLPRSKRHDYFTSALPWPMRPINDSVSITVPLAGTANVYGNGKALGLYDGTSYFGLYNGPLGGADDTVSAGDSIYNKSAGLINYDYNRLNGSRALGVVPSGESGLYADLTTASGVTINQLRESFQIQRFLEREARGGSRYTEQIRNMFGVISPDARLQRPEYLGGSSHRLDVNVVPQTSASVDGVSPQTETYDSKLY